MTTHTLSATSRPSHQRETAACADQTKDHVVINLDVGGGDERARLLDETRRPSNWQQLQTGPISRNVHYGLRRETESVAKRFGHDDAPGRVDSSLHW